MTAVRASDGGGCGTFVLGNNDSLQIVPGEAPFVGRSYVEHTSQGTRTGLDGPVSWTFDWRAPDPLEGPVYFFCAGNAADGTFDPGNDFIYTTADTVPDIVTWTPVAKVSWGSLKARYR
jgi:hypothetical protein